ncbi:hypothetical protein [Brachyspira aalborgi]|uniref:Uncharacterized protein n=1 Tax=Brachyspira aalborgi TaxID=29522 RepID=A0A5C8FUT7_9SPIR|nr:hypothetical protein [Brachyspira aalborgi]TXJ53396.1 hypothetical protein EPJ76_11860 [Brachyspira aalborgi]
MRNKKDDFINNFVDRYKDNGAVYNNDFYKDNSELMKIDAMYFYLARAGIICSISRLPALAQAITIWKL